MLGVCTDLYLVVGHFGNLRNDRKNNNTKSANDPEDNMAQHTHQN